MMNFDEIWPRFGDVVEDMRQGMAFFEGYIPRVAKCNLFSPLLELSERANTHSLECSIWSDESTESDWNKDYEMSEYVAFFGSGKIVTLHFDYEILTGSTNILHKPGFPR